MGPTMTELKAERVRVIVGHPKEPGQRMVPVTIHDMESRRCRFQSVSRDQLEVMEGDTMGEWMAIFLPTADRWSLVDYVSNMRKALKVVA
jgi:hypothetical protein